MSLIEKVTCDECNNSEVYGGRANAHMRGWIEIVQLTGYSRDICPDCQEVSRKLRKYFYPRKISKGEFR